MFVEMWLIPSATHMTVRQIEPGSQHTVVELLRRAEEENADVEAYVEPAHHQSSSVFPNERECHTSDDRPRRSMTFAQWDRAADGLAALLRSYGVGRGDVVSMLLVSSLDYAVGYAAAVRLGAVVSGVNPRLGHRERESIFSRTMPKVSIVDSDLGLELPANAGRVIDRAEAASSWTDPPPKSLPILHDDDPIAIVWTSGTTGAPKGAVFDHRCLEAASDGTGVLSRPGDRRLSPLPFAHVGYMAKVWDEIAHGVTTVITASPWKAEETLCVLVAEHVTVAQGVPTQWALLVGLDDLDGADLSSLRIAATGGAPMPASLVREVRRKFRVPVVVRYASTETAICTGTLPDDSDHVVSETVGRPVNGVEMSLVDDLDEPVATGEIGRVRIRSRAAMLGYWGPTKPVSSSPREHRGAGWSIDIESTRHVRSAEGWVTTGDLGMVDVDGNLHLSGRRGERYIRGGYNVYPLEVEEVLRAHPGVHRVAVVGVPDAVLGEIGVAFVVRRLDATGALSLEEIRDHCHKALADYKAPDAMVLLDDLPLTAMMKVDKRVLAAMASTVKVGKVQRRRAPSVRASTGTREQLMAQKETQ